MRTRFCILAVLAALAVGLTVCSHRAIYAQREEVAVEQVVLQGEPVSYTHLDVYKRQEDQGAVRFSWSWFNTEAETDAAAEAVAVLAEEAR